MLDLKAVAAIVSDNQTTYYASDQEYWQEQLARLDLMLYRQFTRFQRNVSANPFTDLKGLVITEQEIARYLSKNEADDENFHHIQNINLLLDELNETIWERVEESGERGIFLSLPYLFQTFQLERLEQDVVLLCLAVELDRKYEKIFAYLQDDVTQKNPTVGFLIDCLCEGEEEKQAARELFFSHSALFKYFLDVEDTPHTPFLSRKVKLDGRILEFFVTSGSSAPTFDGVLQHLHPDDPPPSFITQADVQDKLYATLAARRNRRERLCMVIWGAKGAGKKLHVHHLAARLGRTLLIADLRFFPEEDEDFRSQLRQVVREAMIQQGLLCLASADLLFAQTSVSSKRSKDFWPHQKMLEMAIKIGVKIATGTDCGSPVTPPEYYFDELLIMEQAGMSAMEVIQASTRVAAECLGLEDRGVISQGKKADLIIVQQNPLDNLAVLKGKKTVVKDGVVVRQ